MAAELEIWLLGGFRTRVDGRPVPDAAWQRSKARGVVKLLALADGHRMHREQLMDLLWPDLGRDAAAANLRKAVHFARHALRPEHVLLQAEMLLLPPERIWVDVDAFDAAADGQNADGAMALYIGDLLPEDRFEEWAVLHRDRLRARFGGLLRERADRLAEGGDLRAAAEILERLAVMDPLNEQVVADLMRAHMATGQRHLALGWYRNLERRLVEDLGVAPGAAVRRLRADIAEGSLDATAASARAHVRSTSPRAAPPPERKLVTVLLAAPGAAPGSEDRAEQATAERDAWVRVVVGALELWGAAAQSLAGTGVLAVFGLPAVHEDDPVRALRAGLEVAQLLGSAVEISVATGEVIASSGSGTDPGGITGEALDAAFGLRPVTGPGCVVATERTYRDAGPGVHAEAVPGGWRVLNVEPLTEVAQLDGPIVGRDAELAVFAAILDDVARRRLPRVMTIIGAAGVGKSRLLRAAVAAARCGYPGLTVLQGRCVAMGQDVTYLALTQILQQACGISIADPADRSWPRLRTGLRGILSGLLSDTDVDAVTQALSLAAGIPLPNNPLKDLPPKQIHEELARAWSLFASGCAAEHPALILVEDLHWASPALLDMIEVMVRRAAGPVLVVGTARPEFAVSRRGFGADIDGFASISLQPLTEAHSGVLLDQLIGAQAQSPARELLLARAEGNPLFLEQLALHIAGTGEEDLPDTLQALLAARIDTVSGAAKQVLQWAATVGRVFWAEPIQRGLRDRPVAEALSELERRGLIVARGVSTLRGGSEFRFRHALIQEVAYASMPKDSRARAHATIGEWLTGLPGDDVIDLLAHHFGQAATGDGSAMAWPDPDERDRVRATAFRNLIAAGDIARRRFDLARAVELHTRAQTLAHSNIDSVACFESLGQDHEAQFHGDQASECYLMALEMARRDARMTATRARLCRRLAFLMANTPGAFRVNPQPSVAERLVAEGLQAVEDEAERAWLLIARAVCARLWRGSEPFGQGEEPDPVPINDRIVDAERAAQLGQRLRIADLVAKASEVLYVLYGIAGSYSKVVALTRRQLANVGQARSRLEQADILRAAAVTFIWIVGDFRQGLDLARRAHELSVNTNPHQLMHTTCPVLAALYQLGMWDEMADMLDEHVAALADEPALGCDYVRDGPLIGATMLAHRKELDRAALLAAKSGDPLTELDTATAWQARYAVAAGNPHTALLISGTKSRHGRMYGPQHALAFIDALAAVEDWTTLARELPAARASASGNALLLPHCDRAEGRMLHAAGHAAAADDALRAAMAGFQRLNVPFEAARTRVQLASVLPAPQADSQLAAAHGTFDMLGIRTMM